MDRATTRAVVIRIVVVAVTLVAMLLIALIKGTGNAEATIDLARAQHAAVAAVMAGVEPTAVTTIGYEEVVDPASGCAYLAQTARLFLADASAAGDGYLRVRIGSRSRRRRVPPQPRGHRRGLGRYEVEPGDHAPVARRGGSLWRRRPCGFRSHCRRGHFGGAAGANDRARDEGSGDIRRHIVVA